MQKVRVTMTSQGFSSNRFIQGHLLNVQRLERTPQSTLRSCPTANGKSRNARNVKSCEKSGSRGKRSSRQKRLKLPIRTGMDRVIGRASKYLLRPLNEECDIKGHPNRSKKATRLALSSKRLDNSSQNFVG